MRPIIYKRENTESGFKTKELILSDETINEILTNPTDLALESLVLIAGDGKGYTLREYIDVFVKQAKQSTPKVRIPMEKRLEVLGLLGRGFSYSQVVNKLGISKSSVSRIKRQGLG